MVNSFPLKSSTSIWICLLVFVGLAFTSPESWNKGDFIRNDAVIYYQYLPALFEFNDLTFEFSQNLPSDFDGEIWINQTEAGNRTVKMTCGTAILNMPFYLIAFSITKLFHLNSYGYSPLYQIFLLISALFYTLSALVIQYKLLKNRFSERVVFTTLLILGIGTNLTFYTCFEAGMTHHLSFFLFSSLLYLTIKWHEQMKLKHLAGIGVVLGLIVLVRPSNLIAVLIPIFYAINSIQTLTDRIKLLQRSKSGLIISLVLFVSICSVQMLLWKSISGSYFSYGYGEEGFFWSSPKVSQVLLGFRKGWFIYTPLALLGIIGLCLSSKELKDLRLCMIIFLVIHIFVVSSWWCWWYGGSFGMRPFIEIYGFFGLFIAVVLEKLTKEKRRWNIASMIIFIFISLNLYQSIQFKKGIIHHDSMTLKAYFKNFFILERKNLDASVFESPNYEDALKGIDR